jgi:hypothetical protein
VEESVIVNVRLVIAEAFASKSKRLCVSRAHVLDVTSIDKSDLDLETLVAMKIRG